MHKILLLTLTLLAPLSLSAWAYQHQNLTEACARGLNFPRTALHLALLQTPKDLWVDGANSQGDSMVAHVPNLAVWNEFLANLVYQHQKHGKLLNEAWYLQYFMQTLRDGGHGLRAPLPALGQQVLLSDGARISLDTTSLPAVVY